MKKSTNIESNLIYIDKIVVLVLNKITFLTNVFFST